jgi:predicted DNA-binding transcriptional regulator AlpA
MTRRADLEPRGLSRVQAAAYVGVGTTLFNAMIKDGRMPKPFRINTRILWDRYKLDAAFDALSDQNETRWLEPAA